MFRGSENSKSGFASHKRRSPWLVYTPCPALFSRPPLRVFFKKFLALLLDNPKGFSKEFMSTIYVFYDIVNTPRDRGTGST